MEEGVDYIEEAYVLNEVAIAASLVSPVPCMFGPVVSSVPQAARSAVAATSARRVIRIRNSLLNLVCRIGVAGPPWCKAVRASAPIQAANVHTACRTDRSHIAMIKNELG